MRSLLPWILVSCAISCAEPPAAKNVRGPSPLPAGVPAPGAPDTPWADKTRDERLEYMGLTFFPRMREVFRQHGGGDSDHFRCQSCHGEDMEAVHFRMPNGLRALPEKDPLAAAVAIDRETAQFMSEKVAPLAVELLGGQAASPSPCHLCHAAE